MSDSVKQNLRRGRAPLVALALILLMLATSMAGPTAGGDWPNSTGDGPMAPPSGFVHRPLVEFFTGLSCPVCMNGPHPETEEMYEAIRDDGSVPWTYVVFHELNGGGVDGLANDESFDRMRHYQPGLSGTPAIEVDGGWHTLGGVYGIDSITPGNLQGALDSAEVRYERQLDPRHPRQFIRNDFKFVNLEVAQYLQGDEWVVTVKVSYLGMDRLFIEEDLRGSLYVFMVEDDVTAHSTVTEEMELNHNVYRGYAIDGMEISMSPGEERIFAGGWKIPEIVVDPNEEYPDGEPVPVKSMDITAVAALYDLDDTSSGDGVNGNPNLVARCIQSATPQSTAYDLDNIAEPVGDVTVTMSGTTLSFEAAIEDADGVSSAAVHFSTEGSNGTYWTHLEMGVSGDEVCDDEGVCYAYSNAAASASTDIDPVDEVWYVVTYTDGLGALGKTEVLYAEVNAALAADAGTSVSGSLLIVGLMVGILVVLAVLFLRTKDLTQRRALATIMVLVIIVGGVFAYSYSGGSGGEEAPSVAFTDIDGNSASLGDFQGKVVVLDMMATWCPGCRAEMPELVKVHDRYGESIEMITVDIDLTETSAQLRDFKREYGAEWRFTMDNEEQHFLTKFRVETIPKIVVIDINGKVVYSKSAEIPADELSKIIDEALTGGRAPIRISEAGSSMGALLLWAGVLGILTFFSPCSFPMLPGYMTYYMGLRESKSRKKAIMGGIIAASGIILLFMIIAILVGLFGSAISQYVLYLMPIVGVMLIVLSILIILDINLNFGLLTFPVKKGMAFSKRTLDKVRGKEVSADSDAATMQTIEEGGYVGLFLYGVGYGAAAAGCMAPIVIALILLAASQGSFLGSIVVFLVFAMAMAAMMVVFTYVVANTSEAGGSLFGWKPNPKTVKILTSGMLMIVGVYIIAFFALGYL